MERNGEVLCRANPSTLDEHRPRRRPLLRPTRLLSSLRKDYAAARRMLIAWIDRMTARARAAAPEGHSTKPHVMCKSSWFG